MGGKGNKGGEKKSSGKGRERWQAGQKLYDDQLLGKRVLKTYLPEPSDEDGEPETLGLQQPEVWLSPPALAKKLSSSNTELVNWPAIGWSELASTVACLLATLVAQESKVFTKAVINTWSVLWESHNMGWTTGPVNPNLPN